MCVRFEVFCQRAAERAESLLSAWLRGGTIFVKCLCAFGQQSGSSEFFRGGVIALTFSEHKHSPVTPVETICPLSSASCSNPLCTAPPNCINHNERRFAPHIYTITLSRDNSTTDYAGSHTIHPHSLSLGYSITPSVIVWAPFFFFAQVLMIVIT